MHKRRVSGWIMVALGAAALGLALGYGIMGLERAGDDDAMSTVSAAPKLSSEAISPSYYSIYLVGSEEEAERVREWAVYGEAIVVPKDQPAEDEILDSLDGIIKARRGRVSLIDLR